MSTRIVGSHTLLSAYENCPYKVYRTRIKKDVPYVQSKEAKYGDDVHKALERRVAHGAPLPVVMQLYEPIVAALTAHKPYAEQKLGIRADGSPCGYFDDDVEHRMVVDVLVLNPDKTRAVLFDYKTGNRRERPEELQLHAVGVKAHYPQVQVIFGHYVWLQTCDIGKSYDLSHTEPARLRAQAMLEHLREAVRLDHFPKQQNMLCAWCDCFDCQFNKTKERLARERGKR